MAMDFNEQGDVNNTPLRAQWISELSEETRHWLEEDARYFLHQALSTPVMNVLQKTEGAWIEDLQGKRYLDLHGNGVHNAGFSNPAVMEAVMQQLTNKLAFTPRRYTNLPVIKLAKKLVELSPPELTRVLFCPGGSEAIEMAVTLAKQVTGRWKTISYWDSYHGNGFQSSTLGGEEHFSNGQGPMVPGAFHVEFPNYYRNPWGLTEQAAIDAAYLRQVELILRRHPDVAAIVAEPISATPVVPSLYYWQELRRVCDENGILLIFDEIIEGLGRTGKWFACEHFVTPDVLVLGKSLGGGLLPFAGILTREKYNTLQHRSIGHYTHEKNPLCATAGLAAIEFIEQEGLVENAANLGTYLLHELKKLQQEFDVIGNVAGRGFHIGLDLVEDPQTKKRAIRYAEEIMYYCLRKGIAFKIIEGNILTMRPALTITQADCDFILDTLRQAFHAVKL
ncbi:aspartate aminotransferase family protein [Flavihumibacter sp. CACIAM 22H1]|uniref:(R)-1-hydroxy-2-aminoethylphosphonate ammonia-lyase n=1 Tax=Flavihumibacter sp. CACIAM 22H1 TaxID=1812911 RepID=UPI0007A89D16|nr:aspartate aminotransferase family protein [Flavihumibacter sp. CACIAM 22H1]KYP15340.1 MAG: acetylornithine aminotransferase [Flavihumibacter sp. CACIAM 22H1]